MLLAIADRIEARLEMLALTETRDNGKPIRRNPECRSAAGGRPFPPFAGCLRAQEGTAAEIDQNTVAYHILRAAGRSRPDHSVELPAADGRSETGAGAGGR